MEIDQGDTRWVKLRSLLYTFFLAAWQEVQALYQSLRQLSEVSERSEQVNLREERDLFTPEIRRNLLNLKARERELWLPILTLALYFDKYVSSNKFTSSLSSPSSQPPLLTSMLSLALDSSKERHMEDATETGDMILVQVLFEILAQSYGHLL